MNTQIYKMDCTENTLMMTPFLFSKRFVALLCIILLLFISSVPANARPLNSVAVVVNDEAILESDIQQEMKGLRSSYAYQNRAVPSKEALRNLAIDQQVLMLLQRQEAKRLGIVIDDARLNESLRQIASGNGHSVAQLRELVVASGLNWNHYREQIRIQVATSEARNANMRQRIQVLPQEIQSERKNLSADKPATETTTYTLSQIILSTQYNSEAEQMQKAKEIIAELNSGTRFSVAAIKYSDADNAANGGSMGTSSLSNMPSYLSSRVAGKKAGIVGPFKTNQGIHLVKIESVNSNKPRVSKTVESKARHILLTVNPIFTDEKAKKQLEAYRQEILSGKATFAELAENYSADAGSAVQGGDLGWSTGSAFVPEFQAQFKKLKVDQISQPFKTTYGWHILQITDRRNAEKNDALNNEAYQNIFRQRFSYEIEAWLQELKSSAYIQIIN